MVLHQKSFVKFFPSQPGCYLMKDALGMVLYIGKAKNIRARLMSYRRPKDPKTALLMSKVADIETIITNTESEALILESQLILQYHPRYNIDLQTPGRYAFLKITDEEYPRIVVARRIEKGSHLIGPFPSAAARVAALFAAYRIFRLCKQKKRSGKACLRFHLGKCSGACVRAIPPSEYREHIRAAERFLRGDMKHLISDLKKEMARAAAQQKFEHAKLLRDQIIALEKIQEQNISNPKRFDQDVVYSTTTRDSFLVQLFHFHKGIISGRKEYSFRVAELSSDNEQELLTEFLERYYASNRPPREIIAPYAPTRRIGEGIICTIPQKGKKKKLLEMVKKNVFLSAENGGGQITELQKALHLSFLPNTLACIDISTLAGTETVASLVRFSNGQPNKGGYRKFRIKKAPLRSDYASIKEVVTRFAQRVQEGREKKPDLLIIDGGKGQLNSALRALSALGLTWAVVSLAKRLEEVYVSWARVPLRLPPNSAALQLLQRARDEAHRFAVSFQRKRRRIKTTLR